MLAVAPQPGALGRLLTLSALLKDMMELEEEDESES